MIKDKSQSEALRANIGDPQYRQGNDGIPDIIEKDHNIFNDEFETANDGQINIVTQLQEIPPFNLDSNEVKHNINIKTINFI